jgi:hypothetical protein
MDQISILFKEYDALRTEIQSRTQQGFQIAALSGGILTWLLSRPLDYKFWVVIVSVSIVFAGAAWTIFRDINKASVRLKEIEQEINFLAGAPLLQWESYWGSATAGYFSWGPPRRTKTSN